jgi:hypothetical protein
MFGAPLGIVPREMIRLRPWSIALVVLAGCTHFRERPDYVNRDTLAVNPAEKKLRGALVSVDTVHLEAPLDGTRHTDDARRALEVALNDAGYSLAYQSANAVHMQVNYTAKYKDFARDSWSENCCAQLWSICATAHLARHEQRLEDMTVCDENVEVRDIADVGMERIAAKLVAALGQDESAKAILLNSANQPVPEDTTPEKDDE